MKGLNIYKLVLVVALIMFVISYNVVLYTDNQKTSRNVELFGYTPTKEFTDLVSIVESSYVEGSKTDIYTGLNEYFNKVDFDIEAQDLNLVYAICENKKYVYKFIFKAVPDEDRVFLVFCYRFHHGEEEGGYDLNEVKMERLVNQIF